MGFITSWIANQLTNALKTQITDEVIEGLGNTGSTFINDVVSAIDNSYVELIKPGWELWDKYIGEANRIQIVKTASYIGATIAMLLFLFTILKYLINPEAQRTTPLMALRNLAISAVLIYCSSSIMEEVNTICANLYNFILIDCDAKALSNIFDKVATTSGTILGLTITCLLTLPYSALVIIIVLIVCWPVIKNYFRYIIELIERYLVSCVILLLFPVAAGTIVTDETSNIFKSYCRMLGGQAVLLLTSVIFLKLANRLIFTCSFLSSITGYIFVLGYLRVCQRIDSYMNAMGINVAQTGGGLVNSVESAGRGIGASLIAANMARKGVGGAMQAIGAATNNKTLFDKGSKLGSPAGVTPTASKLNKDFAKAAAASGKTISLDKDAAGQVVSNFLQDPRNNLTTISALSGDSLNEGIQALAPDLNDVSNVRANYNGTLAFDAADDEGNMHSYTLSGTDSGLSQELVTEDGEGTGMYLNTAESLQNEETVSGTSSEVLAATGAMGLQDHSDLSDSAISSISSATRIGNDTLYQDDNGNVVARLDSKSGDIVQPGETANAASISSPTTAAQISKDIETLYHPDGIETTNGKSGGAVKIRSADDGRSYVQIQKDGDPKWQKVYFQDVATKGKISGDSYENRKVATHTTNSGLHVSKICYAQERTKPSNTGKPPKNNKNNKK